MLREILARFGVQFDERSTKKATTAVERLKQGMKGLIAAFGAGIFINAIRKFTSEMVTLGDETAKTARQMGISGRQLQAYRFAAERSGVEAGELTNGIRRLQRNIVDASEGVDTAVRAFGDLGVSVYDADGNVREVLDILPEIADGFVNLGTATQRSARAQQLFGRSGAVLLPFFEGGSAGIRELTARFEELGAGMGEEFLLNAEAAQDAMSDWNLAMLGLKSAIASSILPLITSGINTIAGWVASVRKATEGTMIWRDMLLIIGAILVGLALKIIVAFFPVIAVVAAIGAAFFAVVAIVNDLFAFMRGQPSVIGKIVEAVKDFAGRIGRVFSEGIAQWVELFRGMGAQIADFFVGIWDGITSGIAAVVQKVREGIQKVKDVVQGVAGFFGFDLGGGEARGQGAQASQVTAPQATVRPAVSQSIDARTEVGGITINGVDTNQSGRVRREVLQALEEREARRLRDADRALVPAAGMG